MHAYRFTGFVSVCGNGESLSSDRSMGEVEDDRHSTALHMGQAMRCKGGEENAGEKGVRTEAINSKS